MEKVYKNKILLGLTTACAAIVPVCLALPFETTTDLKASGYDYLSESGAGKSYVVLSVIICVLLAALCALHLVRILPLKEPAFQLVSCALSGALILNAVLLFFKVNSDVRNFSGIISYGYGLFLYLFFCAAALVCTAYGFLSYREPGKK